MHDRIFKRMKAWLSGAVRLFCRYKDKLIVCLALLLYVIISMRLGIGCILRRLTGIPCPGCGMTRALLCAAQLRFADAFRYHMMVWSVPILVLALLKDGKLFQSKRANSILYGILLAGFLLNWLRNFMF